MNIHLKKYSLETELSQEDHFTLYQARQKSDNAPVIIKMVLPLYSDDEFFARRFKQIAQQMAQLDHPHILPTSETKQENGRLYIVQDNPQTQSLAKIIENEGSFSPQRMQDIAEQIASALDYAHQKSVTHGDLSTQQIYLGPDDHVFVANFGQVQSIFGTGVSKHAQAVTSPETLAPERVQGQGPSRQADLYALGILCYQMLTTKPPFIGPASTVLHAQAHKQPQPVHIVNARVPIGVSRVIERMLSKGVELRYNTGAEFTRALAMAKHNTKPSRRHQHFMPLIGQEHHPTISFKSIFYLGSALVMMIFIAILFAWAGYEMGLKRAEAQTTSVQIVAAATIVALQTTPQVQLVVSTRILSSTSVDLPTTTPTPTEPLAFVIDTLLPTPIPLTDAVSPAPTPTLTPTLSPAPKVTSVSLPASQPSIPHGQAKLVFYNPTGYDLVIDLTGPTNLSELIPPNQKQEFLLVPGSYQYIVHTLTGTWLDTITAKFELGEGQLIEKDYYSNFDGSQ